VCHVPDQSCLTNQYYQHTEHITARSRAMSVLRVSVHVCHVPRDHSSHQQCHVTVCHVPDHPCHITSVTSHVTVQRRASSALSFIDEWRSVSTSALIRTLPHVRRLPRRRRLAALTCPLLRHRRPLGRRLVWRASSRGHACRRRRSRRIHYADTGSRPRLARCRRHLSERCGMRQLHRSSWRMHWSAELVT